MNQIRRNERLTSYLFLAPSLLIIAIFVLGPAVAALYLSFTEYNIIQPPEWIGLGNYLDLIGDNTFLRSMKNTAHYALIYVPGKIIIGLFLAVLLQQTYVRAKGVFLTAFYIPVITSVTAASFIWLFLYRPGDGIFNSLLKALNLPPQTFIYAASTVVASIAAVTIWKDFGLTVVLFVAGLQGIDKQLYDAASIDGASGWQTFWRITLPLLRPVFLLVLITTVIDSFNVFTAIIIMTDGGPAEASTTIVHQIYNNAFVFLRMGKAAAMSMVLLVLVSVLSVPAFMRLRQQTV